MIVRQSSQISTHCGAVAQTGTASQERSSGVLFATWRTRFWISVACWVPLIQLHSGLFSALICTRIPGWGCNHTIAFVSMAGMVSLSLSLRLLTCLWTYRFNIIYVYLPPPFFSFTPADPPPWHLQFREHQGSTSQFVHRQTNSHGSP